MFPKPMNLSPVKSKGGCRTLPSHKHIRKRIKRKTNKVQHIIPPTQKGEASMGFKDRKMEVTGGKCEIIFSKQRQQGLRKGSFYREGKSCGGQGSFLCRLSERGNRQQSSGEVWQQKVEGRYLGGEILPHFSHSKEPCIRKQAIKTFV